VLFDGVLFLVSVVFLGCSVLAFLFFVSWAVAVWVVSVAFLCAFRVVLPWVFKCIDLFVWCWILGGRGLGSSLGFFSSFFSGLSCSIGTCFFAVCLVGFFVVAIFFVYRVYLLLGFGVCIIVGFWLFWLWVCGYLMWVRFLWCFWRLFWVFFRYCCFEILVLFF